MRIGFISYEYPPDTAFGGIATYVGQAARMLARRGHSIEVFAASHTRERTEQEEQNLLVHRVKASTREVYRPAIAELFASRHAQERFDVVEGPEYAADADEVIRVVPEIPLVLKFHTPVFLAFRASAPKMTWMQWLRAHVGAMRGRKPWWHYDRENDLEYLHATEVDEYASPSLAIGNILTREWSLDGSRVSHVPYPYDPSPELLAIPQTDTGKVVTFLGRLEPRKGVEELFRAMPLVLQMEPEAQFRFVGRMDPVLQKNVEAAQREFGQAMEVVGPVPLGRIPEMLTQTQVCVFPSRWESFGLVCLEAMAAARGVVASSSGGMAELLKHEREGLLTPPHNPAVLARSVVWMLRHPRERAAMGAAARQRVREGFNSDRIARLQIESYQRAITRRAALGPRRNAAQSRKSLREIAEGAGAVR